jgi:ATP-dependent Clp protease ATP-binding subunit ClpA
MMPDDVVFALAGGVNNFKSVSVDDELSSISGLTAAVWIKNNLDAANILKPVLGGSGIRCIGATTFSEYRRIFEKEAALARRFQKIHIDEPKDAELTVILNGIIERLSAHHKVIYAPTAAASAVHYSRRFLPSRFLPDKAIDVLDDAGAQRRFAGGKTPVDDDAIATAATAAAGLPQRAADHGRHLRGLEQQLASAVIDQPEAAKVLANAVLRLQLGYHDSTRTAGAFLFAGPTGVGKTEMSRRLAGFLGVSLLRFDMSECMEAHAVSRLIGAPPGYVGYEQSGQLVERISHHPNAVVLLDEIEKAHPDVLNILLQVMDYGVLTDNAGRRADFSGAILVMTTNAGAAQWERAPVGFSRDDAAQAGTEALSRQLSPEFRNRLDAVVRFTPLGKATLSRILSLRLKELSHRLLVDKKIHINVGRRLRVRLLADGFSAAMGARPLERLIREHIMEPLAQAEAAGQIVAGGRYALEDNNGVATVNVCSVH